MNHIVMLAFLAMVAATHGCVAKTGSATLATKRGCCAKGSPKQTIVVKEKTPVAAKPCCGSKAGLAIQADGEPATRNVRDAVLTRSGADMTEPNDVVSLADSLNPLREHFNANKGKARFIALLSPT